jgi:hypothetical protein
MTSSATLSLLMRGQAIIAQEGYRAWVPASIGGSNR